MTLLGFSKIFLEKLEFNLASITIFCWRIAVFYDKFLDSFVIFLSSFRTCYRILSICIDVDYVPVCGQPHVPNGRCLSHVTLPSRRGVIFMSFLG